MKLYAIVVMMLVLSLPLVRAQVPAQPAAPAEQPVIPDDIAMALVGVGSGPAVSVMIDVADTCVALVSDVLDTCFSVLLCDNLYGLGTVVISLLLSCCYGDVLWNCLESWARLLCCSLCPLDFWCQCLPCVSCIPHTLNALRSACNLIPL